MRRGRDEWAWRLSVCGPRRYRFCVAARDGLTEGYIAARRVTPGSSRILGKREAAIITDLVVPFDNRSLSRALIARVVSFADGIGAAVALAATTVPSYRNAYASCRRTFPYSGDDWPAVPLSSCGYRAVRGQALRT